MKIFKKFFTVAAFLVAFLSCQKELSFDNGGVSAGSFKKDVAGDCAPVTVNGIFKVDSVLSNAQYVDVEVSVSTPGNFEIRSDTVNGFSFRKVGSVVFGSNTIRLYPSGKPIAAGSHTFTVRYGNSTCSFDITVAGPGTGIAAFTLGGAPGACTGAVSAGTYMVGTPLTPSNTLVVQVDVTTAGTYVLSAATTSGFAFTASGVFTTTGLQNVTLTGTGTPTTAGVAVVTVSNIASNCVFNITVLPAGGGTPAIFTLDGAPAGCTGFTLAGTYNVGTAVTAANTVKLNVTVTTAGSYNITTNTLNGITFSGAGVLALGAQQITLTATGTPTVAGAFVFKPNVIGTCDFSVNCVAGPPVLNNDYFPLTANSWWSYDIVGQPDTIFNIVFGTKAYSGNTYTEVRQEYQSSPVDTTHYRKSGNDYFEWVISDAYSAQFGFDNPATVDINFLKENAATGTTWQWGPYTGTVGGTANVDLRYDFKIENANTTLTVSGKNFTNVIHVSVTVQLKVAPSPVYTAIEKNDFYYAKGIGLIKIKYNDLLGGGVLGEIGIRNYKVN